MTVVHSKMLVYLFVYMSMFVRFVCQQITRNGYLEELFMNC